MLYPLLLLWLFAFVSKVIEVGDLVFPGHRTEGPTMAFVLLHQTENALKEYRIGRAEQYVRRTWFALSSFLLLAS